MRLGLLILASVFAAQGATWCLTVAGLGGDAEFDKRFAGWAQDIDKALKGNAGAAHVETLYGPAATRERVTAALAAIGRQAQAQDALVLMLIGHGTYDGVEYKFNLPGPDLSARELSALLDRVPAGRQLVVNMTSASGATLDVLGRPNRIVIAATKAGTEKNATIFARYWAEALRDPAADTDKNETVSAQEAFQYAERKTAQYYETQKLLATEHARLEGQGAAVFALARFGQAAAAGKDPAKRQLLARKEELEQQIDRLKLEKAALPPDQYKRRLAALLVDLAKTQAELDK